MIVAVLSGCSQYVQVTFSWFSWCSCAQPTNSLDGPATGPTPLPQSWCRQTPERLGGWAAGRLGGWAPQQMQAKNATLDFKFPKQLIRI